MSVLISNIVYLLLDKLLDVTHTEFIINFASSFVTVSLIYILKVREYYFIRFKDIL